MTYRAGVTYFQTMVHRSPKVGIVFSLLVLAAVPTATARGAFERSEASEEVVVVPEWVQAILDENYGALYPGEDGDGYIGIGIGATREEALAAAAVDFAGNVSTVVNTSVQERGRAVEGEEAQFDVIVESEVRSQAIVSGLEPNVWEDPRAQVVYALYRTTVEEYDLRLAQWITTMEAISEAERRREIQRVENERAAAERRLEEIKLEELQDQVRLADRQMRANRYRDFLYQPLPVRMRGVPTGYVPRPGGSELSVAYRAGSDEAGFDGSWDFGLWDVFLLGVSGETVDVDDGEYHSSVTARAMVRLLDRVGWVVSTTVSLGAYGGMDFDEFEDFEDADPVIGPFLAADVLVPEFARTRYSLYLGTDVIHGRVAWYPFWDSIGDAVALGAHVRGAFDAGRTLDLWDEEDYFGLSLAFHPVESFWITLESYNVSYVRGTVTISF
ncbi:MAG: DUF4200 domain-containing protein [Spirochaetales bacterium]|nr:DUF4200 domain-containing protein [Spirochaetales bacterium]